MNSKDIINATTSQLAAAGGIHWIGRAGAERVYFNDLPALFGLECSYYKTGNVFRAQLDGETISNCEAKRILADLGSLKLFVDTSDMSIHVQQHFRTTANYDYESVLVAELVAHVESTCTLAST